MSASVKTIINFGASGMTIDIECHISNSLPNIIIVGFANRTVDEAKERLRGAFSNAGLQLPRKRISINLAPADVPKDSSSLDMAIAVAILAGSQQCKLTNVAKHAYIGELGLDGTIRPVRGIIGKLLYGRDHGIERFYVPAANMLQAQLVPNIELIGVNNIRELYLHLNETEPLSIINTQDGKQALVTSTGTASSANHDLSDIVGQIQAKRALMVAAAGGHNILLNGPPGTGKSMLAKTLPLLLPALSHEEMLEVTHLHSLAGHRYDQLVTARPFRAPHHSASNVAIVGGGNSVRPGEISLSHRGVLLFDELPEFPRLIIEALRQPLEDRCIVVSRAKETVEYPACFTFVATANPCPCGYFGTGKTCECSPAQIERYRRKLSGPLLDRIDICVNVDTVEHDKLLLQPSSDTLTTSAAKKLINKARQRQQKRYTTVQKLNTDMNNQDIKLLAGVGLEAKNLLDTAARKLDLSARAYMRAIKVARTIADLAGSADVLPHHLSEALQYRAQSVLQA